MNQNKPPVYRCPECCEVTGHLEGCKAGTLPDLVMAKDGRDESIANGAKLTEATFADFVQRLRHHVRGEGVDDHCTADALFVVQSREIIFGIDRDYTDKTAVAIEDSMYFSVQEYWDDAGDHCKEQLEAMADGSYEKPFLKVDEQDQWDMIALLDDHTVSGWNDRWDYVNSHLTKEAAEAFIKRKKHDYQRGLRVYVEAQVYCWEFNQIIEALMDGRIVLATPASPASAPEAKLRDALALAIRQNECDMVMTGEELRTCWAALTAPSEQAGAPEASEIRTWQARMEAHYASGSCAIRPIQDFMAPEIAELREALAAPLPPVVARKDGGA